ncbi:MAG: hypothetical protein NDI61_07025 [Bdellovibrionaceae bacterium]|nr:hypothetical protein [Pseudobdellovibrionaceae bacterium]
MKLRSAIAAVNRLGVVLVFPINNKRVPPSLWYEFFPRTRMRWEWDDTGSQKVSDLWHLRERLSTSGQVVYSKWFRGRATLVSRRLFPALLRSVNPELPEVRGLSYSAREILDLLEEDSPISTKRLKALADLSGRENESRYNRALRELWSRHLIVVFGEVDEGAFPSIAIGATKLIFEELWDEALALTSEEAQELVRRQLPKDSPFLKFHEQVRKARLTELDASEVKMD